MTPEQIKKEDVDLFHLKNWILSQTDEYNRRLKRLENVRPTRYASRRPSKFERNGCEGVMGLGIKEVLLENIMIE